MVFYNPEQPKPARILFNDPGANKTRRDSAEHVYDDKRNPAAGKQRGGKPEKRDLQEIELESKKNSKEGEEEPGPIDNQLAGLEDVSTHATR